MKTFYLKKSLLEGKHPIYFEENQNGGGMFWIELMKDYEWPKVNSLMEMCSGPGFMGYYLKEKYLDENEDINLCIEYGVNLTDEYKVFEYFVNSKIMTEKVLQNINKTAELKIPFKIPTFKNEKNYNLKLENINDLLKNSIKLSPISFYQSSALNEQIAQGLAIESELE